MSKKLIFLFLLLLMVLPFSTNPDIAVFFTNITLLKPAFIGTPIIILIMIMAYEVKKILKPVD